MVQLTLSSVSYILEYILESSIPDPQELAHKHLYSQNLSSYTTKKVTSRLIKVTNISYYTNSFFDSPFHQVYLFLLQFQIAFKPASIKLVHYKIALSQGNM